MRSLGECSETSSPRARRAPPRTSALARSSGGPMGWRKVAGEVAARRWRRVRVNPHPTSVRSQPAHRCELPKQQSPREARRRTPPGYGRRPRSAKRRQRRDCNRSKEGKRRTLRQRLWSRRGAPLPKRHLPPSAASYRRSRRRRQRGVLTPRFSSNIWVVTSRRWWSSLVFRVALKYWFRRFD